MFQLSRLLSLRPALRSLLHHSHWHLLFTGEEEFQFALTSPAASLDRRFSKILCRVPTDPELKRNSLVDLERMRRSRLFFWPNNVRFIKGRGWFAVLFQARRMIFRVLKEKKTTIFDSIVFCARRKSRYDIYHADMTFIMTCTSCISCRLCGRTLTCSGWVKGKRQPKQPGAQLESEPRCLRFSPLYVVFLLKVLDSDLFRLLGLVTHCIACRLLFS